MIITMNTGTPPSTHLLITIQVGVFSMGMLAQMHLSNALTELERHMIEQQLNRALAWRGRHEGELASQHALLDGMRRHFMQSKQRAQELAQQHERDLAEAARLKRELDALRADDEASHEAIAFLSHKTAK